MKAVIGICAESAFNIKAYIDNFKRSLPENKRSILVTQFMGFGHKVKKRAKIILCPTFSCLTEHLNVLNKMQCVVIVLDSPIVLSQAKIPVIDAITNDHLRWSFKRLDEDEFILHLRAALNNKQKYRLENTDFDLVPKLLYHARGSLTQMLLNITMRCRVPHRRREITTAYIRWLLSDYDIGHLIQQLEDIDLDDHTIDILVDWFKSDEGAQARLICRKIGQLKSKGKPINYDKLCKDSHVMPFDLKYLFRQLPTCEVDKPNLTSKEDFFRRQKDKHEREKMITEEDREVDATLDQSFELDVLDTELDFSDLEEISY